MNDITINSKLGHYWTKINDYWFHFYYNEPEKTSIIIKTAIKFVDYYKEKFDNLLDRYKENNIIKDYKSDKEKYIILLDNKYNDDELKNILLTLTNALTHFNALSACYKCGKPTKQGFTMENEIPIVVCNNCQEQILKNSTLEIEKIDEGTYSVINKNKLENNILEIDKKLENITDNKNIESKKNIIFEIKEDGKKADIDDVKEELNAALYGFENIPDIRKNNFFIFSKKKTKKNLYNKDSKPSNNVKSFFLAIVGAFLGSFIYLIFSPFGFVANFLSSLISSLAFIFYYFSNGKDSFAARFGIYFVSLIFFIFVDFTAIVIAIYNTNRADLNKVKLTDFYFEYISKIFLEQEEVLSLFFKTLGIGTIFLLGVPAIFFALYSLTYKKKIL